jgi:hypothetical protein
MLAMEEAVHVDALAPSSDPQTVFDAIADL